MKTSNTVLDNLSNGDRFCDRFTKTGKGDFVGIFRVELFENLIDEDASLDVPIHSNDTIGYSFSFGTYLPILFHLRLVSICCGRCLRLSGVHLQIT